MKLYQLSFFLIISFLFSEVYIHPSAFSITRIQYDGGGDWYADPSSLPNLLKYFKRNTSIPTNLEEQRSKIGDDIFKESFYLYLTGHGNIRFSDEEAMILRDHLITGAFLHADDNYGMDKSFRMELNKVFPDKDWVELPPDHEIFHSFYKFDNGLPKVHEHDNKRPQALALFEGERMIVLYTYESDLGDGWEDREVHDDSEEIRENALKMGVNIIVFALTQ